MKKIIGSIMLLGALFCAAPAEAQVRFGVEGGLNLSKAKFSEDAFKSDNRAGFFIGPKVQFKVPLVGLGVDGALLYSQKKVNGSVEVAGQKSESSKTLPSIEVPINVRYSIGMSSLASLFFTTGPQFGWNIGSKKWNGYTLKNSNFSWNIGAGVQLLNHLQVGVGYNFAFNKTGDMDGVVGALKNTNFKANTFQAQVAYLF